LPNKIFPLKENPFVSENYIWLFGTKQGDQGPMLRFLKYFRRKKMEKMALLTQNKAKLYKILIVTLVFEKNAIFSPKIGKNR
jgi:hypothetical protein